MGFRDGAYARVLKVTHKEKSSYAWISIRDRNASGEFEESFNGTCFFLGKAKQAAADLQKDELIRLEKVDVSSTRKDGKNDYFFRCWEFDFYGRRNTKQYDTPDKDNTIPTPLF